MDPILMNESQQIRNNGPDGTGYLKFMKSIT